ncbi:hydrolase [Streptomyces mashuensis]|uniref:Hydrolase n=1 Tax=Streptomyces mashuensis TaxID=33904 RepID=A0A919AV80_9ACTN|nr:CocE/NonD family hydrolase [Streptomyces mashuensis]GHF26847.1 hydrolase [Streptomyces mashuensis]
MRTATTRPQPPRPLPPSVRALRRTLRGLPGKLYDVAYEPGLVVPAADGSALLTDHYLPARDRKQAPGDFPTVLIRSPYGRGFPWAPMFAVPLAEQGFHVVLQSCRGTGGSGGTFDLWRNETADGTATVAWLREQPWFTGVLGTTGPSYLGFTQWALALDPPPELRAMVVQEGLHDLHAYFRPGGTFALQNGLTSAMGLTCQHQGTLPFVRATARLQRRFPAAARTLPLGDAYVPALGTRVPFVDEALAHADPADPAWRGADAGAAAESASVPTCLISGWSDVALDQTLQQYERLRRAGCERALLIGPWTHHSLLQRGWPQVFAETLAWLRAHLCGDPSGLRPERVRVHEGGGSATGTWRDLADWPPAAPGRRWYPAADGTLSRADTGEAGAPFATYRYDPADPVPSTGGPLLDNTAGPRDQSALEARDDVLTFTTAPLREPLHVRGPVSVSLRAAADTGHADVFARLCDVDGQGRSVNICDGIVRLPPDTTEPADVTVAMSSTAHCFASGHRIRLQVSGGAHPRFARHTGTGDPLATATRLVPAEVTLHHPAALALPVTEDGESGDDGKA